jgi:hypothetical protein
VNIATESSPWLMGLRVSLLFHLPWHAPSDERIPRDFFFLCRSYLVLAAFLGPHSSVIDRSVLWEKTIDWARNHAFHYFWWEQALPQLFSFQILAISWYSQWHMWCGISFTTSAPKSHYVHFLEYSQLDNQISNNTPNFIPSISRCSVQRSLNRRVWLGRTHHKSRDRTLLLFIFPRLQIQF